MLFSEYRQQKLSEYGEHFDASDLDERFVDAFETQERIRVRFGDEVKTGTVSATTGWRPVFILMLTKRSFGSIYMLNGSAVLMPTRRRERAIERAERAIDRDRAICHDVAAEYGQMFANVKHMRWFVEAVADELE